MTINVNAKPLEFESPITITELLSSLNMAGKPVVVELNQEATLPNNHNSIQLQDKDFVEIIVIAAGG